MEYVPSSVQVEITAKAQVSAAKLGLTGEQLAEVAGAAHRINRYKDGLRLWHIRAGERAGWVAVHEVLALDGTGRLAKATAVDVLSEDEVDGDTRWRERVVMQARPRHKSGPHYLARAR
jgi:hypothetical protein